MATDNLFIPELAQTQNQKVVSINNALNALDNASNRVLSKTVTGNDSITAAQWRDNGIILFTGTPAANLTIDFPAVNNVLVSDRSLKVFNTTGRTITLRAGTSNTNTITLNNNEGKVIGSNKTRLFDLSGSSSGGGSGLDAEGVRDTVAAFVTDTDTIDFTHDDSGNTLKAAVKSNSINAAEINVSGNGTAGQALLSDGDGSFSFGSAGSDSYGTLYTADDSTHEAAWTGIPSGTTRISLLFDQLRQATGDTVRHFLIQIGDSGGYETSGYTAGCLGYGDSTWSSKTTGFCMERNFAHNGAVGEVTLTRTTASSNIWICSGGAGAFFASNDIPVLVLGRKELSSTLDRIRVIMENRGSGEDFYSGTVSIAYR